MAAALRLAVPLILSSIGGCFGDRTGIFNIALESFMLCAAFFATLGTYYSGNPYTGVLLRDPGQGWPAPSCSGSWCSILAPAAWWSVLP